MTTLFYTPAGADTSLEVTLNEQESVLDGLLRSGNQIPFGCRSGVCQSCMLQSDSVDIPAQAQQGLKASLKAQGYFLSCSCIPSKPMHIGHGDAMAQQAAAKLLAKDFLSPHVLRLRFEKVFDYRPGQFLTVWRDESLARSYSIASHPNADDCIELHIKVLPNGGFSAWAAAELKVGDKLNLLGPAGDCFYTASEPQMPILLAGIGTGLAPLYGIARDALSQGHTEAITLFLGAKQADDFYFVDQLNSLADAHSNFSVCYIALEGSGANIVTGDMYQELKRLVPDTSGHKVFLCGAESFVKKMKKQCFLAGANMPDIAADAFVAFAPSN